MLAPASTTDIYSAVCAIVFALIGIMIRLSHGQKAMAVGLIANDLLKGGSFFPFLLLAWSIIYPPALVLLIQAQRFVLFTSGCIAALYVLGEFIRAAQGKIEKTED